MSYRIYSKTYPAGVVRDIDDGLLTQGMLAEVEARGVYRGLCPCCDKRIVVRFAGERSTLTAGDEHFLLHDGQRGNGGAS
jgi:hypothetical protein